MTIPASNLDDEEQMMRSLGGCHLKNEYERVNNDKSAIAIARETLASTGSKVG